MNDFAQSVRTAFDLIVGADAALPRTVGLSLAVSGTACMFAPGFGPICGAWLAVARFPGHRLVVLLLNTLLALPSVVVGLVVYLLLSRGSRSSSAAAIRRWRGCDEFGEGTRRTAAARA